MSNKFLLSTQIDFAMSKLLLSYRVAKKNLSFYSTIKAQILLDDPVPEIDKLKKKLLRP